MKNEDTEAVYAYLAKHKDAVIAFEEANGVNGHDLLVSSTLEEVKELLQPYIE